VTTADEARELAARHLAGELPARWKHVQTVAAVADQLAVALDVVDGPSLVVAAWLHDIGYARDVAETGFHALDGARYLRRLAVDDRVACLVAHHSCAVVEAEERGLSDVLTQEFAREESPTADALVFADMTTGPNGMRVSVQHRLQEIGARYGAGDVVTRSIARSEAELVSAVGRTKARLHVAAAAV
jgi:putative nucleotidyltransferase with HDIG domain